MQKSPDSPRGSALSVPELARRAACPSLEGVREVGEVAVSELRCDLTNRYRSVEKPQHCALAQECLVQRAKRGPLLGEAPLECADGYRQLACDPLGCSLSGLSLFQQPSHLLRERRGSLPLVESSLQIVDGKSIRDGIREPAGFVESVSGDVEKRLRSVEEQAPG